MPAHLLDSSLDNLRREFDDACDRAAQRARAEQVQTLNQLFRRFRAYQTESDWVQTMVDAASHYSDYVALFSVGADTLQLLGQTPPGHLRQDTNFATGSAAAFSSAIESKDTVTALRSPSEVSPALSESATRAHIFPITNGDRVSAVLFAADGGSDMNALELVAGLASSVLERKANLALHAQISAAVKLKKTMPVVENAAPFMAESIPAWTDLPLEQRQLHIRAQRFARVTVAELQLARPEACRSGREQGDLYLFLKREIEKARDSYRKQFMATPSIAMVDYLHLELIQTAAEGDERKLGADYPGRLL